MYTLVYNDTVELMGGTQSLSTVKGIYDVVKLELDTRNNS